MRSWLSSLKLWHTKFTEELRKRTITDPDVTVLGPNDVLRHQSRLFYVSTLARHERNPAKRGFWHKVRIMER